MGKRLQSLLSDKDYNTHRMLNGPKIASGIMSRKGLKARGGVGARDDVVKAVRKKKEDTNKRWATQEGML